MDFALKQRLLGAAVLIALAIIFVPMFLGNSPPKEASAIQNLDIPPIPERKFETRTLPVDAAAPQKPAAQTAAPPNPDKVVTVATFYNLQEADIAMGLLESCGIACFLCDEHMHRVHPLGTVMIGGVRLQVAEQDLELATELLKESPPEEEPPGAIG